MNCKSVMMLIFFLGSDIYPFREVNGYLTLWHRWVVAASKHCLPSYIAICPLGIEATSNEGSMNGLRGYYAYAPSTTF